MMSWLLAFLIHSTLWCGIALLWTRIRPGMHARTRETIWCTAIAASVIVPSVQVLVSPEIPVWRLELPALLTAESGDDEARDGYGEVDHRASETSVAAQLPAEGREQAEHHRGRESESAEEHVTPATGEPASAWRAFAPWIWGVVTLVLLLRHGGRLMAFGRRIDRREVVRDPTTRRALARLCCRAGLSRPPRLTESENLDSPIALGLGRRREICLPVRALHELDEGQIRAMLGHEVAHHLRCDPLRSGVLAMLRAACFFQPLFHVGVRAIRRAVEEQCDEWAAGQIEDRLAMASCLVEVATWIRNRGPRIPASCMARRRSHLGTRVDRLMDGRRSTPPARAWRWVAAAGLLALAPWLAPSVAPASDHPHRDSAASAIRQEHREQEEHTGAEAGHRFRDGGEHDEGAERRHEPRSRDSSEHESRDESGRRERHPEGGE
jgi:beta-lactamase regulating signal transducer with metallopeptidase domain